MTSIGQSEHLLQLHKMAEDGCELGRPFPSPLSHPFPQHSHLILQQLNLQRHYGVFCDVILRVDRYEFKAHKCVLAAGCPKLQSQLYSMHQETSNVLSLKQVSVTGCRYILDFLYTGSLELKAMHVDDVIAAAKFLEVRDVEKACLDYQYYKELNGDTVVEDSRQAEVLSQPSHVHFVSEAVTEIPTSNLETNHAHTQACHTPSPTLPPISTIEPTDYRPTSVPPPIDSSCTSPDLDPPALYPPASLPSLSLPQQNMLHQLPVHSTSNLSFDTNYIEDYLKLIESMQNEQTAAACNVTASSQLLSRPHPAYLDIQPNVNSQSLATTAQPAKSTLAFPGVGPNSTQFSAEDVRKTVLSVLSQEKFEDDDVSLSESDSVASFAKHSSVSVSPGTHSGSLPSIAHIVSSHNHTPQPSSNHCDAHCDPSPVPDSTLDTLKPSQFTLLSSPDVTALKDEDVSPPQDCPHDAQHEITLDQTNDLDDAPKEIKPNEDDDEEEEEEEDFENYDELTDDQESPEQKNGFILTPKLACKQKRKKKSLNKVNSLEKECSSPLTRLQHRLVTKRKRRFDCEKCGRQFEREEGLIKHQELHDRELLYSCHVCGLKYARSGELTRHLRKHSASLYSCKPCHVTFKDPKEYKKHMTDVHEEDKPFRCQFVSCNFTADKPSLLEKHAAIHSDVKMYACPKCGKDFAQPNGLRSHLKSCLQQRSYLCDICGSKFNHLQSLKSHRMLHTGEKPHICKDCGARFTDHRNFKRHRRIHENLFPYPCSYCEKRFRHSNSLKAHLKTHGLDPSKMPAIIGEATPSPNRQSPPAQEDDGMLGMESHDDARWREKEMVIPVTSPL